MRLCRVIGKSLIDFPELQGKRPVVESYNPILSRWIVKYNDNYYYLNKEDIILL